MKYGYRILPFLLLLTSIWLEAPCGLKDSYTGRWKVSISIHQHVSTLPAEIGMKSYPVFSYTIPVPNSDKQVSVEGIASVEDNDDSNGKSKQLSPKSLVGIFRFFDQTVRAQNTFFRDLISDGESAQGIYLRNRSIRI
jgi:hypothetical protein